MNRQEFKDKWNEAIIAGEVDLGFWLMDQNILCHKLSTTIIDASYDVLIIQYAYQLTLDEEFPFFLIHEQTISNTSRMVVRERWFEGVANLKVVHTAVNEL